MEVIANCLNSVKKSLGALAPPNGGECRKFEKGGNCHVVKDCCYPLPVNSKLTIWQLMSFLLQELYNLYLHLTNKFNLNMTTLYFFVNFFYLHLLEDKKKFRHCRVIIFRLLCNAMILLVFKHFKKTTF